MKNETVRRRSAVQIMGKLIVLIRPLLHIMVLAIVLGTAGYICAIFLTILAGQVVLQGISSGITGALVTVRDGWLMTRPVHTLLTAMIVLAILRGLLHYAEQYCNHFIAFQLLAIIRHHVFAALRTLCPAKLEGREKGNLIAILTTDIELLEVFYAHTISPIAIAILTSIGMVCFMGRYHWMAGALAVVAYSLVGVALPLWNGRRSSAKGMAFRTAFGSLNSFVLDSLRGLDETMQYHAGDARKKQMDARSQQLSGMQKQLCDMEGAQRAYTNAVILLASFGMLFLTVWLYQAGSIGIDGVVTCTIAMMGSFGPVVALSNLSNNLNQTLASGERVWNLLEEKPLVEEVAGTVKDRPFTGAQADHVTFAYEEETILSDYCVTLEPGKIIGIHGASGSGKSTLLKLLMRFWDVQAGEIRVSGQNVRETPTCQLRQEEAYVTQETQLFHDSIANNIGIGKTGATREEIIDAAKKAALHDFVCTLPKGYDTEVGELGETLSGGERQRIGIARAFLHDAPFLLMDEPTSNLDSLNEGVILKSIREARADKTVVLVSHRDSTMRAADKIIEIDCGRNS